MFRNINHDGIFEKRVNAKIDIFDVQQIKTFQLLATIAINFKN